MDEFVELVRLKTSTLIWHTAATWGETIDVTARCPRVGRTSFTMTFELRADGRPCCSIETTYVFADRTGTPQPIEAVDRERLLAD